MWQRLIDVTQYLSSSLSNRIKLTLEQHGFELQWVPLDTDIFQ